MKHRTYTQLYALYWKALCLDHLGWADRLHYLAHEAGEAHQAAEIDHIEFDALTNTLHTIRYNGDGTTDITSESIPHDLLLDCLG